MDIDIQSKDWCSIVGPSGSGKTVAIQEYLKKLGSLGGRYALVITMCNSYRTWADECRINGRKVEYIEIPIRTKGFHFPSIRTQKEGIEKTEIVVVKLDGSYLECWADMDTNYIQETLFTHLNTFYDLAVSNVRGKHPVVVIDDFDAFLKYRVIDKYISEEFNKWNHSSIQLLFSMQSMESVPTEIGTTVISSVSETSKDNAQEGFLLRRVSGFVRKTVKDIYMDADRYSPLEMGRDCYIDERYDEAIIHYCAALRIMIEKKGVKNLEVAEIYSILGVLYDRGGNELEARISYHNMLDILKSFPRERRSDDIRRALSHLEELTSTKNRLFDLISDHKLPGVEYWRSSESGEIDLEKESARELANVYEQLGMFDESEYLWLAHLEICKRKYGDKPTVTNHVNVREGLMGLKRLCFRAKRPIEERKYRDEIIRLDAAEDLLAAST